MQDAKRRAEFPNQSDQRQLGSARIAFFLSWERSLEARRIMFRVTSLGWPVLDSYNALA